MSTPTKIRLRLTADIDIDLVSWEQEYGTAGLPIDVENYLLSLVTGCPAAEAGALTVDGFAVVTP